MEGRLLSTKTTVSNIPSTGFLCLNEATFFGSVIEARDDGASLLEMIKICFF
jgi:hypothetical protein